MFKSRSSAIFFLMIRIKSKCLNKCYRMKEWCWNKIGNWSFLKRGVSLVGKNQNTKQVIRSWQNRREIFSCFYLVWPFVWRWSQFPLVKSEKIVCVLFLLSLSFRGVSMARDTVTLTWLKLLKRIIHKRVCCIFWVWRRGVKPSKFKLSQKLTSVGHVAEVA